MAFLSIFFLTNLFRLFLELHVVCFSSIIPEHNSMVGNFILSYLLFYKVIGLFNARLVPLQIILEEKNFTPFTGSLY